MKNLREFSTQIPEFENEGVENILSHSASRP
jgi:hypothetical protein